MNKIPLFLLLVPFTFFAQTNETSNNRYDWGRKGTEPAPGYVVLKSGKKMEGTITLKGEPNNVKKIILLKDGKEIELEPASLSAYGLSTGELVNDSPEDLYEWKAVSTSTVMGKQVTKQSTKERRGYLILNDKKRIDGMLHLNKKNGEFEELVIKNDADGKQVFTPQQVSHYGLVPTIEDLSKGGTLIHHDNGKNFYEGFAVKNDDSKTQGYVAFMRATDIPRTDAVLYQNLYYAAQKEDALTVIATEQIKEVTQKVNGTDVIYVRFKEGFVEKSKMSTLSEADQYKLFQEGKVVLKDNVQLSGQVAQVFEEGKAFSKGIKFKDAAGAETSYTTEQVIKFEQTISKTVKAFAPFEGEFVGLMYDGSVFSYFKHPHPKSINKSATQAAKFAAQAMGSLGSAAMVNSMEGSKEDKAKARQNISNASTEELKASSEAVDKAKTIVKDEKMNNELSKGQAAMNLEAAGREASKNILVYNVEFCILNKKSGDKTICIKNDFGDTIEPLLKSCEEYLMMDKGAQKKCKDIDNVTETLKMMDACYGGTK